MASDADSSSFTASTSHESARTRGMTSAVWAYSRTALPGEDPAYKYCLPCTENNIEPPYKTKGIPSNLRAHLKSKHSILINVATSAIKARALMQLRELYAHAESSGQTEEFDQHVLSRQLDQDVTDEALVSLIVVRRLPFRMVEWPEFHAFCQALNPQSKNTITTAHSQIHTKITRSWNHYKDIVRQTLQSAVSSIHLSLDIWTSPNGHLLLGIVAHCVDHLQEGHIKALLALRTVEGHSGENQFNILLLVLQDYGILHKLGAIVSDNASTNDTLCRTVESYLFKETGLTWDASKWRIRCTGHIINLAVQAFLFQNVIDIEELESYDDQDRKGETSNEEERKAKFRLMGPLGKLHNTVVHIRSSPTRSKVFINMAGRMIPLDNRTRWNSWHQMLIVAIEFRSAIDSYIEHYTDLEKDALDRQDWTRLRAIKDFLAPFHRATLETQGNNASIDKVLFTMDVLISWFEKSLVSRLYI